MSKLIKDLASSAWHPREVASMIQFKMSFDSFESKLSIKDAASQTTDVEFAYLCLHKVSRSFALVIQLLDPSIRDAICLFYLILRGLDSVEDDMDYPIEKRVPLLRTFHTKLYEKGWKIDGCGDSEDYRQLLSSFDKVISFFLTLPKEYQVVIADITDKMGNGMADFSEKNHGKDLNGVDTVEEYELYCHYVAGLVGLGLDRLFVASKLEDYDLQASQTLANSMGLFLQKVNITRDYLEDIEMKRSWWPKEIWGQYSNELSYFAKEPHSIRSRLALNNMIYNALKHVPDVMEYCGKLQNQTVFNFCAIPQVMAISTLALLYNNTNALTTTIKIRKGIVCDVALNCTTLPMVQGFFMRHLKEIQAQLVHPDQDPIYANATKDEKALAITLYNDFVTILDKSILACQGYTHISDGWEKVLATVVGIGAIGVGVGVALMK